MNRQPITVNALQDPITFFSAIFRTAKPGYLHLVGINSLKKLFGRVDRYPYSEVESESVIRGFIERRLNDVNPYNIYYPVNLTNTPDSRRVSNMSMSNLVYADLDACDPKLLKVTPTLLVETSPNRHHGLWVLENVVDKFKTAQVSRAIAAYHRADGADQSGWDSAQILRVPGTLNFNRIDSFGKPAKVQVTHYRPALYRINDFSFYIKEMQETDDQAYSSNKNEIEDCPNYVELDDVERARIDLYVSQAIKLELEKFDRLRELEIGDRYKYKKKNSSKVTEFGWSWGCVWVSRALIELANAPWNGFELSEAKHIFFKYAPRDDNFGTSELSDIWWYSVQSVNDKKERFRRFPHNSDVVPITEQINRLSLPDTWQNYPVEKELSKTESQIKLEKARDAYWIAEAERVRRSVMGG